MQHFLEDFIIQRAFLKHFVIKIAKCRRDHTTVVFLLSAMKLGQGNIFTSVCQELCPRGVSASVHAGIHTSPDRHPPGLNTPTPLPSACWDRHGYCRRRYASYWNAFLFPKCSDQILWRSKLWRTKMEISVPSLRVE